MGMEEIEIQSLESRTEIDNNDNKYKDNDNKIDNNSNNNIVKNSKEFSLKQWFKNYFNKFKTSERSPPLPPLSEFIFSFIGSLLGIGLVAALHYHVVTSRTDYIFLIGSFAASAVLIFGATKSPLAQPRNLILGHFVSAIVGCTIRIALRDVNISVACAIAVALAIVVMMATKSLHPPGGATAMIAVMNQEEMWAGYFFIFVPVMTGAFAMLSVALIINNLSPQRKYPAFWY